MAKLKSIALALGVTGALTAAVALGSVPAFAQDDTNSSDAYGAGMAHGHTLNDPGECGRSGSYHEGCVSGAEESQFDDQAAQAAQARRARMNDWTPSGNFPLLSPPPDLFHDPYSKPGDSGPPND
jgi:hypothetical protein